MRTDVGSEVSRFAAQRQTGLAKGQLRIRRTHQQSINQL